MGLSKNITLTIKDYEIKLDKEIKSDNKPTYKKDKQYSKSMLNRMKSLKNKIVRNPARQKKVESGN